jgi:hypothetical protein
MVPGSVLAAAVGTFYTAPAATVGVVKAAQLINTTGGAVPATVYLVPSGGAAAAANTLISARAVAAGETYNCPELVNQVIEAGGTLQALGNGLTLIVSGVEIV